ncbi:hypothetical protein NFI96_023507 [Prochilodus magdalenae]|nr:hypothetical protein NFI96_023507 [Prochilodus magdalenae]
MYWREQMSLSPVTTLELREAPSSGIVSIPDPVQNFSSSSLSIGMDLILLVV